MKTVKTKLKEAAEEQPKKPTSFSLDGDLLRSFRIASAERNVNMSDIVALKIREWLGTTTKVNIPETEQKRVHSVTANPQGAEWQSHLKDAIRLIEGVLGGTHSESESNTDVPAGADLESQVDQLGESTDEIGRELEEAQKTGAPVPVRKKRNRGKTSGGGKH